jgi:hypothetical protein
VNSKEVNAFALPGGFLYVNRGLIETADNESELAGVLGHEIGHVAGKHSLKQISKQLLLMGIVLGTGLAVSTKSKRWGEVIMAGGGIGIMFAALKYSRDDERQSDWLGLESMTKAGYDPQGMMTIFQKLDRIAKQGSGGPGLAFLRTHPAPEERVRNMEREIQALEYVSSNPIQNTPQFDRCKRMFAMLPAPPPGQDKTLSAALASLDAGASTGTEPSFEKPARAPSYSTPTSIVIPGNSNWIDTGINVSRGQIIEIRSWGRVYWIKNSDEWCGPDGAPGTNKGFWKPISKVNTGALVGKIGSNSTNYFAIGASNTLRINMSGRLYLGINDDNNLDNRGSFNARIRIGN